jgi:transcriptional regulator with PAS, ATPase and Fis domain
MTPPRSESETLLQTPAGALVGRSVELRRVVDLVRRVASTPRTTVLIQGESGVGKELVARAVHEESARRPRPYVGVNCAALTEGLLEAELFGYVPGAFTGGSAKGREGLFAAAEGGTLLLDEIGELAPALQAKLLRVLQERVVRRVGGEVDQPVDVRIVTSTNRDLGEMVAQGRFREDLYYRLNVMCLTLPALRERPEDVAPIARHHLERIAEEHGTERTELTPAAQKRLREYAWPGNVRQLTNVLERALLLSNGAPIEVEHLDGLEDGLDRPAAALPRESGSGDRSLRSVEEQHIRTVLQEVAGNRSRAASVLGINRSTLYNKLRTYAIHG